MFKVLIFIMGLVVSLSGRASSENYLVQQGDGLAQILRAHEYGQSYVEIKPYVEEVIRLNPHAFKQGNVNFIIPGTLLSLPQKQNEEKETELTEKHSDLGNEINVLPLIEAEPEQLPVELPVAKPPAESTPEPAPGREPEPAQVFNASSAVSVISGNVEIFRNTETLFVTTQADIKTGDILITAEFSSVDIKVNGHVLFKLGSNTQFVLNKLTIEGNETDEDSVLSVKSTLQKGEMAVFSFQNAMDQAMKLEIKSAMATTITSSGADFTIRSCLKKSACGDLYGISAAVMSGAIRLSNTKGSVDLNKNEFGQIISASKAVQKEQLPAGFFDLDTQAHEVEFRSTWKQQIQNFFISRVKKISSQF